MTVIESDGDTVELSQPKRSDAVKVAELLGVALKDDDTVAESVPASVAVMETEGAALSDACGLVLRAPEPVMLLLAVALGHGATAVAEGTTELLEDAEALTVGLTDSDEDAVPVAPTMKDGVTDAVGLPVPVRHAVEDCEDEALGECEAESVLSSTEGDADVETVAVCERSAENVALPEEHAEADAKGEAVAVAVVQGVAEVVGDCDCDSLVVDVADLETVVPADCDAVAVAVDDAVELAVAEAEDVAVALAVAVVVVEEVAEAVAVAVLEAVAESVGSPATTARQASEASASVVVEGQRRPLAPPAARLATAAMASMRVFIWGDERRVTMGGSPPFSAIRRMFAETTDMFAIAFAACRWTSGRGDARSATSISMPPSALAIAR